MIILAIIASLPLLAVLGHDFYMQSFNSEQDMQFSELGFLWTKYHPESYKAAVDKIPSEYWEIIIELLKIDAYVVTGAFAAFFYVIFVISAIIKYKKKKKDKIKKSATAKWQRPTGL